MTPEKFRELQLVQASIMDDIHRVCVNNNLRYYMIGGTALGAVRHKGFIPWDVDIDIAMPRQDYEKFIEIANDELNSKHECHTYMTDKEFYSPHILVALRNSTIMLRNVQPKVTRWGIYVDILPLDQVPVDRMRMKLHANTLSLISKIKFYKNIKIYPSNGRSVVFFKKIVKTMLSVISFYSLNKCQQWVATWYNSLPDTGKICSTLSHYKYEKLCMDKAIWGNPVLYEFEGRKYYGPEKIEAYLCHLFGDYLKLPSKAAREDSINSVINASW